jgi:hypothetical protein
VADPQVRLTAGEYRGCEAVATHGDVAEGARRNRKVTRTASAIQARERAVRPLGNVIEIEKRSAW